MTIPSKKSIARRRPQKLTERRHDVAGTFLSPQVENDSPHPCPAGGKTSDVFRFAPAIFPFGSHQKNGGKTCLRQRTSPFKQELVIVTLAIRESKKGRDNFLSIASGKLPAWKKVFDSLILRD